MSTTQLALGVSVIKKALGDMPDLPGCYQMNAPQGEALYIGKAKSLVKRVQSYTRPETQTLRIQRMIAETRVCKFTTTRTEIEALLLESNLIKKFAPRYNILQRDDKLWPQILIRKDHAFPQILKHRGSRRRNGYYFGPFAGVGAVNQTLTILQKAFLLRNCNDTVFANRSRPCLQYQIKHCAAPCVGYVSESEYEELVRQACDFLAGRSDKVRSALRRAMEKASHAQQYERAAIIRDRIRALTHIRARQAINIAVPDADVIGLATQPGQSIIQLAFFRGGSNYGQISQRLKHSETTPAPSEILRAFITQFYAVHTPPPVLLVAAPPDESALLEAMLSERAQRRVQITIGKRGDRKRALLAASQSARELLARQRFEQASWAHLLKQFAERFALPRIPERIEVYDNSHIQGRHAIGAMIVADKEGFQPKAYRKFNLSGKDDLAMMSEMLTRRFKRKESLPPPDFLIVDGGVTQISVCERVLAEFKIDTVATLGMAKGKERNAGRERFFVSKSAAPFTLEPDDAVLFFLQRLRDEAHRFAISSHRRKREKQAKTSILDDIPGVGARRRRQLLIHLGSARKVAEASLENLADIPGIDQLTARRIYEFFHEE